MDISNPSRSWFPFAVLMVILVGVIVFFIFDGEDSNIRQSNIPPKPGCVAMQDNGDYTNSVDIVFLPDNYQSIDKFRASTDKMMETFFSTVPFDSYRDRFNFFRIENLNLALNCDYEYGGDAIVCDPSSAKNAAISCPHDYVIVAVDVEGVQKLFELLRSSAWMGIASINTDDDPLVLTHEFAHLFADFADEYEFGGEVSWKAPNCDSSWQTCPKFQIVEQYDCERGCVNDDHSRSIKTGIMRDYWKSDIYGSYNEYIMSNVIEENTGKLTEIGLQKSMPLSLVDVRFSKGKWDLIDVREGEGYPDGSNQGISSSDSLSILDEGGRTITEISLASPRLYLDGHNEHGENLANVESIDSTITFALPRSDEDDKIVIKQDEQIVGSFNLNEPSRGDISGYNSQSVSISDVYSV